MEKDGDGVLGVAQKAGNDCRCNEINTMVAVTCSHKICHGVRPPAVDEFVQAVFLFVFLNLCGRETRFGRGASSFNAALVFDCMPVHILFRVLMFNLFDVST